MSEIFDRICRKIEYKENYLSYSVLKLLYKRKKGYGKDYIKLLGYRKYKTKQSSI